MNQRFTNRRRASNLTSFRLSVLPSSWCESSDSIVRSVWYERVRFFASPLSEYDLVLLVSVRPKSTAPDVRSKKVSPTDLMRTMSDSGIGMRRSGGRLHHELAVRR